MFTGQKFESISFKRRRRNIDPFWVSRYSVANPCVEEKTRSLFQPDILLQAHFYGRTPSKDRLGPEKKLMLAILQDAIYCFQNYLPRKNEKGGIIFQEAEDWILDKSNKGLFSFENTCEELRLNPGYIRAGLMDWKKKMLARRPKARVYLLRPKIRRKLHGVFGSRENTHRLLKVTGG